MKNFRKIAFYGLFNSFIFVFGVSIFGFIAYKVYAALSNATSGSPLTASNYNDMITEVNSLRTALTMLQTTVSAINSIPSGSIVAFNSSSCPTGWSKANGTNGTVDLRGEFIRGFDDGRGVDSGRTLSSWQIDMFKSHNHNIRSDNPVSAGTWTYLGLGNSDPSGSSIRTSTDSVGGVETRPRNVSLLYCVKT